MQTIAVLTTCHNRRAVTLACLDRLFMQTLPAETTLEVYLVDDGSVDGTADAVKGSFPDVNIILGDGQLFWCNGMRLAWERAATADPDFYLWLNDDVMLFDRAVETLLDTWSQSGAQETIVVGSCCDPASGYLTYGGQRRTSSHPARLQAVHPEGRAVDCETFQSNALLVPRAVYNRIGMIDSFQHAMGDTDYGYRARKAGCRCLVAPGFLAACESNAAPTYWRRGPSLSQRWRLLNSRKGLPFSDWLRFARRHGGLIWPIHWLRPYLRVILNL